MGAPALRPLRVGEVLDVAIKVYLRNAWTLFKVVLVVVAPVELLSAFVIVSSLPEPGASGGQPFEVGDLAPFVAGAVVTSVLWWVATTLATGACFKAVTGAYLGAAPGWRESLRFAGSRLPAMLWVTFLAFVLGGLGFLVLILPGVVAVAGAPDNAGGVLLLLLGVAAGVVLGIWIWIRWSVAIPAMLTEDVRGRRALGRSFGLVKGRWWPTFGAIALAAIIGGIVSTIVSSIADAVLFADSDASFATSVTVDTVASIVVGVIVTPLQAAIVAIIYFDLRVRKEGFDLELLTQRLGLPSQRAGAAPPRAPGSRPPERA